MDGGGGLAGTPAGDTLSNTLADGERGCDALDDALAEAMSVLQAGGDDARKQALATSMAQALLSPAAAQVWASAVEAADAPIASPSAFFRALLGSVSAIAGVLFASAAFGM